MNSSTYSMMVENLRTFFLEKDFQEVPTQSRLSIMGACEDPRTVSTFVFDGQSWPLPQTGQMWLEHELLTNPDAAGFFCLTTSYRNEPNPIKGRHDLIFPMFEFESHGDMDDLIQLEKQLLTALAIPFVDTAQRYLDLCSEFSTEELEPKHEEYLEAKFNKGVFITNFPESSDPFWNMKRNDNGTAKKVDVILGGMETIGSAERATDVDMMRDRFHSISGGEYAGLLYSQFGKDRVEAELEAYLSLEMFPRFGGGIGLTRLARMFE